MPARKTYEKPRPGQKAKQPMRKKPLKGKQGRWLWLWLGFTGVAMLSATAGAMLAVSLASMLYCKVSYLLLSKQYLTKVEASPAIVCSYQN